MGYLLEFYSLEWNELTAVLGSGDEAGAARIAEAERRIFPTKPGDGVDWKAGVHELIVGKHGKVLAGRGPEKQEVKGEELSTGEALGLVAIVRTLGIRLGELVHTTRGATKFRKMFGPGFQPPLFRAMHLAPFLLERPLYGVSPQQFPFWGGLRKNELLELAGSDPPGHPPGDLPTVPDADYEEWLYALRSVLWDARKAGSDLITLYL